MSGAQITPVELSPYGIEVVVTSDRSVVGLPGDPSLEVPFAAVDVGSIDGHMPFDDPVELRALAAALVQAADTIERARQ